MKQEPSFLSLQSTAIEDYFSLGRFWWDRERHLSKRNVYTNLLLVILVKSIKSQIICCAQIAFNNRQFIWFRVCVCVCPSGLWKNIEYVQQYYMYMQSNRHNNKLVSCIFGKIDSLNGRKTWFMMNIKQIYYVIDSQCIYIVDSRYNKMEVCCRWFRLSHLLGGTICIRLRENENNSISWCPFVSGVAPIVNGYEWKCWNFQRIYLQINRTQMFFIYDIEIKILFRYFLRFRVSNLRQHVLVVTNRP